MTKFGVEKKPFDVLKELAGLSQSERQLLIRKRLTRLS
jgi:hypothetical protein